MLIGLLLVAIVVPTVSVLWFLNEAITSQTTAARQQLLEAHRAQLRVIRSGVVTGWQARSAALNRQAGGDAAGIPAALTASGADALILLDRKGAVTYPADTTRAGTASAAGTARMLDAQRSIRELVQRRERSSALQTLERTLLSPTAPLAADAEGRLLNADAHLLALTLMSPDDARRAVVADRLAALLSDYTIAMPASQRLFLMEELRAAAPTVRLPTYAAERLAADYLQLDEPRPSGTDLQGTRLPRVWQLASPGGRVLALYKEETIQAIHRALLDEHRSGSVRFDILQPAETATDEAMAIGPVLPGWQASFALLDSAALDAPLKARRASYIWIAVIGLGVLALVALSIGHTMRRQMRLARLKTDLVAAVSHELRTPLASMGLLVDGLRQDVTLDPQKTREYLDLMAVENARLSRLIDNVLTFSRLDRRHLRLTLERVDAAQVVEAAADAMRSRLHPDCELQVEIASGLPPLDADVDALVTALLNLLDNAYKYTPQEKHITLRATVEGGDVVFAVQDNGLGIPAAEQARIFRPFYRVDRRLTRHTSGVGLGLSIVSQIVRAHGGSIRVNSEAGAGSTFSLRLPQASGASA